jgi:predicted O-methyltransferase YrrM
MNKKYGFCELYEHVNIIKNIIKYSGCQNYLELGIYEGHTFFQIANIVSNAVAVDINDLRNEQQKKEKHTFCKMSTNDFFCINKDNFDVIFIDADHKIDSVIKDFENSYKCLNKYGMIFIHDTDPMLPEYEKDIYCGDSYKIIEYIETQHKELNIITLPVTVAGLSIVMRKCDRRTYK